MFITSDAHWRFSPFNEKEWVIKNGQCAIGPSQSLLFCLSDDKQYILLILGISYIFSGNSSHSDCHSSNIYLFVRDFRSENGMSSTEMSPSRASLAAEYAPKIPLMPTWPGTQMKTVSLPSLVISVYYSKIWTKTGWSYFRFNIDCNDERETDNINNNKIICNNKHKIE